MIKLSKHVTKATLTKWSSLLTNEEVTDQYEDGFNEFIKDFEFNVYHASGDVNEEEINILFNHYMQQEQIALDEMVLSIKNM